MYNALAFNEGQALRAERTMFKTTFNLAPIEGTSQKSEQHRRKVERKNGEFSEICKTGKNCICLLNRSRKERLVIQSLVEEENQIRCSLIKKPQNWKPVSKLSGRCSGVRMLDGGMNVRRRTCDQSYMFATSSHQDIKKPSSLRC